MSFSGGGKTSSNTSTSYETMTGTDNAIQANNGSTITVTDGGAFELVGNMADLMAKMAGTSIEAGLSYFDKASASANASMGAAFDMFKSDSLNKSQDTKEVISTVAVYGIVAIAVVFGIKYTFGR